MSVQPGPHYTITAADEVTPDSNFYGTLSVTVTVDDGAATSAPYAVQVTIGGPPNFIVVMADDLDTRTLDDLLRAGLMPNLQASFIDRGVNFTQAFVTTPLCCPSRASFLSGAYPHNTQVINNRLSYEGFGLQWAVGGLDDTDTIATRLQALGYTTGMVGKYLNGYGSDPSLASLSPAFDPHYVPPGWSDWQALVDFSTYCVYNYYISHNGTVSQYLRPPGQHEDTATYQTNVLADLAEAFVLQHRQDAAPFFLWVTPIVPHTEECADAYSGSPPPDHLHFDHYIRPAPEYANASSGFVPGPSYDEDLSDKPSWEQHTPLTAQDLVNVTRQYKLRMQALLSLDLMLGRIVAALGDRLDDTVLVFTSDNGWFLGDHRLTEKILAYDEAARVPLYVAGAGATAAATRANLALNNDLEPTILELAAPGYGDGSFDGRNLAPLLTSAQPPGWTERSQFLIEYGRVVPGAVEGNIDTYVAVRTPAVLYIESYSGTYYQSGMSVLAGLELYELAADPYQLNSLLHYPQNVPDPVYGPWATRLRTCLGPSCKQYENGVP